MFYTYSENNSGGYFTEGPNIIIIEADSFKEADSIAEAHTKIYFDDRYDCECCGSRWSNAYSWNESNDPRVSDDPPQDFLDGNGNYSAYHDEILIRYKDGTEEVLTKKNKTPKT